jgi:hypothetical protein
MADTSRSILRAAPGDRLVIHGHHVGEPDRDGEIVEVHGDDGAAPYTVRWTDGHVSRFYPSSDACVQHFEHRSQEQTRKSRRR